jgi:hypothetical protein
MNWREKHLKIVVGINSLSVSQQPAYSNHIQFFYRLGRSYPNIEFCLVNPPRMPIDRMRNMSAEVTLKGEFDYLLFLDDDVLVPENRKCASLAMLLDADADIVAGDVMIRGYPFNHMYFRYDDKENLIPVPHTEDFKKELQEADAVGFSLCLIKRELLLDVPKPFFITGTNNTEDIYFCLKAKLARPDATIKVDTRIVCSHILWPELISAENCTNFKNYYEAQFPEATAEVNLDYYKLVTAEGVSA